MGKNLGVFLKISTSLAGTIATISGFVLISKFISVYLGAAALLVFSQSRDIIRLSQQITSLNGTVSIVQYLSSYGERENSKKIMGALSVYSARVSIVLLGVILLLSALHYVNWYIGIGTSFFILFYRRFYMRHVYLLVLGKVRNFYAIQVISLFSAICVSGLLSFVGCGSEHLLIGSFWFSYGAFWLIFSVRCDAPALEISPIRQLFESKLFSVARDSIVMLILGLLTMLIFRYGVSSKTSTEYAGYFDAGWSISVFYMSFIFNALMSVLLPEFSSSETLSASEVRRPLHFVIISAFIGSLLLLFFNEIIVGVLFSEQFVVSMSLVRAMAPTEILRSVGWYFGVVLLSKGHTKELLIASLIYNIGLLVSINFAEVIANFKLAYGMINLIYLILIIYYIDKHVLRIRNYSMELITTLMAYIFIWFLT
jgi:O-antigen/teichoic acid export membrane protein